MYFLLFFAVHTNFFSFFLRWNGSERLNDLHVLDLESEKWTQLPFCPLSPRAGRGKKERKKERTTYQ